MRLPRRAGRPPRASAASMAGRILVMLDRGDYWQCAFVIPKGALDALRARASTRFPARWSPRMSPWLGDRVGELASWDDVKLLTVAVDRLRALAPAGPDLHRRRRARHVADRRRRHQSRHPGRGGRRQHLGRSAAGRHRHAPGPGSNPRRAGCGRRKNDVSACMLFNPKPHHPARAGRVQTR